MVWILKKSFVEYYREFVWYIIKKMMLNFLVEGSGSVLYIDFKIC